MKRSTALALTLALLASILPFIAPAIASPQIPTEDTPLAVARETEPVVLTGASFPEWAAPADTNAKAPGYKGKACQGSDENPITGEQWCTHNTYEDPDVSSATATNAAGIEGAPIDQLLGYSWDGTTWSQIPFQVDEMAVRYLSNNNSGFAFYSETDQHTTYVFDREGFRWTESDPDNPCLARPASHVAKDTVPGLDTDDEIAFMARDTGARADADIPLPPGIEDSFEVAVTDPLTGDTTYAYVMRAGEDGPEPSFTAENGYVRYERDSDADVFLFSQSSYNDYGAAAPGPWYDPETGTCHSDESEWKQHRPGDQATISTPRYRFRYDGRWLMTGLEVSKDVKGDWTYGPDMIDQWKARAFQQRPSGQTPCCGFEEEVNNWGGSSILMGERWGPVRAIRETWGADSGTNVVRREIFYRDEIRFGAFLRVHVIPPLDGIYAQWDYNAGIVETYYNQFNPEGISIDGKNDERFGNSRIHAGRDGFSYEGDDEVSDELEKAANGEEGEPIVVGSPQEPGCPYAGQPLEDQWDQIRNDDRWPDELREQFPSDLVDACVYNDIDSPDPTFSGVNAGLNWEQVTGPNGTLVLRSAIKHYTPGGTAQALAAVPYYRDDSCFDDGTGSDPGPHLNQRGVDETASPYNVYTDANGGTHLRECFDSSNAEHIAGANTPYLCTQRVIDPVASNNDNTRFKNVSVEIPGCRFFQGSIGTHGVHILLIGDSDNAGTTAPVTEIDTEQRMVVLPGNPGNVGDTYGRHSEKPLIATTESEDRDESPSPSPTRSGSGSDDDDDVVPSSNVGCDPIDPTACLLPFPNDFFTTTDASTDTGRRVNFHPLSMPRTGTEFTDGGEGKPVDPTEWNRNDGFSPGSAVMAYVPELDLHETWGTTGRPHSGTEKTEPVPNELGYFDYRDHIADIGLYQNADAPMVIINTETGERHPFWSELDTHPDAVEAKEQVLIMRPAVNFEENTRYVVGLRNLKTADRSVIEAGSAFAAYRDGTGPDAQRQQRFEDEIFPVLEAQGVARDDLYLAWDFTVASERNLAGRVLHMRNSAFADLNDTSMGDRRIQGDAPEFIVDTTSEFDDSWTDSRGVTHRRRYRRIEGRVTVPNFMDRIQQTESKVKGTGATPVEEIQYDIPAPGSRLLDLNGDGLPDQNPVERSVNVYFKCEVPLNGKRNVPGLYGHGLLGQGRDQIQDFRRSPGRMTSMFGCAADWWGMSAQDLPTVLAATTDMSHFPTIPDRAQQGFLNFMFIGRAAAHPGGFASDPAFQQDGQSLVKTSPIDEETELVYDGNSQGGIMGGSLVAVSPDINRAILGVPGMNYSTLLNRSVDFEGELELKADLPPYSFPVYQSYRDVLERQVVFGLMQMLWDRGEANGYAHHITHDPLENTPEHDVMLQVAWSDHQVANVSAEVEARTIGAPIMEGLEEHWSYDRDSTAPGVQNPFYNPAAYPQKGSALIYWDSGNAIPPNGNIPPEQNGDPHGHPRNEPAAGWQEAHYLLTGDLADVCNGSAYLTRRHPRNGGTGSSPPSCHPPEFAPGDAGDGDGVLDSEDNCPGTANPGQEDADEDGIGDACEGDRDSDTVIDDNDNCPDAANADQIDTDGDGQGDACDDDDDNDDVADDSDNCVLVVNRGQEDTDQDGLGDECDSDDDADTIADDADNCALSPNPEQEDADEDALGDACDNDRDGDTVANADDNCPDHSNDGQEDWNEDGQGDACDDDIQPPADRDGDNVPDEVDNCPDVANPNQEDADGDQTGDACDSTPTTEPTDDASPTPTEEPSTSPTPTDEPSASSGGGGSGGGGSGGGGSESGGTGSSPSPEPTSTQAGDDVGDISTTIAANRSKVRFRRPFTLSGSIDAPRDCGGPFQVELSRRLAGATSFKTIATLDVSGDMTWTYTARGRKNASYIATARSIGGCEGQSSAPTDVLVRAKLTVKVPATCRGHIRGRLLPTRDEGRVSLQRRAKGSWVKVRTARIRDDSRFRIRAPRCGRFRLVWKSDGANLRTAKRITLGR